MTAATTLELRRLGGRPAAWWLAVATVAGVVLFGFLLLGALAGLVEADPGLDAATRAEIGGRVRALTPAELPSVLADVTVQVAPTLALLAGTVVAGADLRHGLVRLVVATGVPRLHLVAAKHVAAAALAAALAAVTLVTTAVASVVSAGGTGLAWPAADRVGAVLVVGLVGWAVLATLGLAVTVVARSAAAGYITAAAVFVTGGGLATAAAADGWVGSVASALPTGLLESGVREAATGSVGAAATASLGLVVWAAAALTLSLRAARSMPLR